MLTCSKPPESPHLLIWLRRSWAGVSEVSRAYISHTNTGTSSPVMLRWYSSTADRNMSSFMASRRVISSSEPEFSSWKSCNCFSCRDGRMCKLFVCKVKQIKIYVTMRASPNNSSSTNLKSLNCGRSTTPEWNCGPFQEKNSFKLWYGIIDWYHWKQCIVGCSKDKDKDCFYW